MTDQELQAYNDMIKKWTGFVTRKISASAGQFVNGKSGAVTRGKKSGNTRSEEKLKQSIQGKTQIHYSQIDYIGFGMERHGVFVHKGVGSGYIVMGGTVTRGFKTGKMVNDYARSKNRKVAEKVQTSGSINRKPVEWFNPLLKEALPALADKVTEMNADAAVNATKMYIR
jgi:hypothetical protein